MGFFSGLLETAVKTVLTPVAVVADVVDVLDGEEPLSTVKHVGSTLESLVESVDDLLEGEL